MWFITESDVPGNMVKNKLVYLINTQILASNLSSFAYVMTKWIRVMRCLRAEWTKPAGIYHGHINVF